MAEKLTQDVIDWMGSRGIGEDTLRLMGIAGGSERFGDDGQQRAVFFPYFENGSAVNYKARALATKLFTQKKGGKQIFYNLERVLSGPKDVVYIVEGEMDALALIEAGIAANAVLSVPGGAPPQYSADDDPRAMARYDFVLQALQIGLESVHRFVLAVDADEKGRFLRQHLARILGAAKCRFLDWPDGCKDANDMLRSDGADALREYVREAPKDWPVDGLYRLDEIPEPPAFELWNLGIPELRGRMHLAPGCISVGTGYPGMGKTQFAHFVAASIVKEQGIKVALMSAETRVKPKVRQFLRSFYLEKLEKEMSEPDKELADQWIKDHFLFLNHPNAQPTHSWYMNTSEAAIVRHGVRFLLADPFNKFKPEYDRRQMSETDWIGEVLDDHVALAKSFNVHSGILAHPAKPDHQHKGAPTPYMISGSAHWNNRPDQVWCIHRKKMVGDDGLPSCEANLHYFKSRYEDELGHPNVYALKFIRERGRYIFNDYPQ